MSPTDGTNFNPRFSRFSGRPLQSPMGPRLRAQRSPNSPEDLPSDSSSTPSPINLVATPLPVISEKPSPTPPPSPKSFHSEPKPAPKRFMLSPPPKLNFESVAVQWKGLPLEAALWTLNSQELQELVSRAIRLTARESFIRLLSLENLDRALPAEAERLNASKSATQSKYRFLVHRRTMLLQAINSSAESGSSTNNSANKTNDAVSQLVVQLAQTTAECDRVLEELLLHSDQLAQIEQMINLHWASALAVALRKLNKSYARRSSELQVAHTRIEQLEAELDDAWKEAERLAKKMDLITEDVTSTDHEFDIEEAVIGKAEKVLIPSPSAPATPSTGALMQVEPIPVFSPLSPMTLPGTPSPETMEHGHISQPTPQHPNPAPIIRIKPRPQHLSLIQHSNKDTSDTASILSNKSTHSAKSPDSAYTTQFNLVTSARKRSSRTSKSSLRLPRSHSHSRSRSRTGTPHNQGQARDDEDHPPVPDIPLEFSQGPPFPLAPSPKPSSNIVWPGSTGSSHSISHLRTHSRNVSTSFRRYRRTSLDDITSPRTTTRFLERGRRDSNSSYAPTVTVDDIHVPPPSYHQSNEVQVPPRTPTSPSTPVFTLPPMPVLRSLKKRFSNSQSRRSTMTDPRKRLSQSVETALDAVAVPLSPPLSPTSLPLPPSPLTPSSFDTVMTERGRGNEGEQRGRERGRRGPSRSRLFSGARIPSAWLHPDSRSNGERGDRDSVWRRAITASPSRVRGGGVYEHANINGSVDGAEYGNGNGIEGGRGTTRQPVKPYEKLKTLTKRYSLNFPLSMFVDRARPGTGTSSATTSAVAGTGWRPASHVSSPG